MMKSEAEKAGRDPKKIELSCMGRPRVDEFEGARGYRDIASRNRAAGVLTPRGSPRGLEKLQNEVIAKL